MNDSNTSTIRILTFTSLYPNQVERNQGIFVENRLQHLLAHSEVESRVIAPVPWFPAKSPLFGNYATFAAVPKSETLREIEVLHPRYPVIPKIGMSAAPILMALSTYSLVRKYSTDPFGFDLIDSHYFYPDGIAATLLGRWLSKPVTITARGSDVNLISDHFVPRKWILWAASRCAKVITVSDALRDRLQRIGVDPEKIQTLRNGVDLNKFRPLFDRESLRQQLQCSGPTLLSVGNLVELKGHHLVIEALTELPGINLIVIGDGPMRKSLIRLTQELKLVDRVRFEGTICHDELIRYYNAADALILASSREGMANVLLESIACGTPVVATPCGGNPEVVSDRRAGILTKDRSVEAIIAAVHKVFRDSPPRTEVAGFARRFSWTATTCGQVEVFQDILGH